MFRKMREAAERDRRLEWGRLWSEVTSFMLQRGFTRQVDGDDLLFRSPHSATVVILGAGRSDTWPAGIVERWERGDVTITQTDGRAVQTVLTALEYSGPTGRWLAKHVSRQPLIVVVEGGDGWRRRVATDRPFTSEDVDRYLDLIREDRIRALAKEHDLPMEYATVLFDGGAA